MNAIARWMPVAGLVLLVVMGLVACGGGGITPIETAFNKGAYHYSKGNYAIAVAEYKEAVAEDPDDMKARFNLGLAYESLAVAVARSGDPEKAAALLANARAEYDAVLARYPDHPRASINVAAIEWEAGNHDGARARLRALIEKDGNNLFARAALSAHLLREGKHEAARTELLAAREIESESNEINGLLGDVEARLGNVDVARESYLAVIKRDDTDLHATLALGELEWSAERPNEARAWMERALLIHPRQVRAHVVLAAIAEKDDDVEKAVRHLWDAREIDPDGAGRYGARLKALYERLK